MKKHIVMSLIAFSALLIWRLEASAVPAPVASAVAEGEQQEAVVSPLAPGAHIAKSETSNNDFYILGNGEEAPKEPAPVKNPPPIDAAPTPPAPMLTPENATPPDSTMPKTDSDDLSSNRTKESPGDKELNTVSSNNGQTPAPEEKPITPSNASANRAPVDEVKPTDEVKLENKALSENRVDQLGNHQMDQVEVIPHSSVHHWEKHHKA